MKANFLIFFHVIDKFWQEDKYQLQNKIPH